MPHYASWCFLTYPEDSVFLILPDGFLSFLIRPYTSERLTDSFWCFMELSYASWWFLRLLEASWPFLMLPDPFYASWGLTVQLASPFDYCFVKKFQSCQADYTALFTLLLLLLCLLLQNLQSKLIISLTVLVQSQGACLLYNNNTDWTGD